MDKCLNGLLRLCFCGRNKHILCERMCVCVCVQEHEVNHYTGIKHSTILTGGKLGRENNTHKHTPRSGTVSLATVSLLCFSSYAGRVIGSTFKTQRENPETSARNTDPVLKGAKVRLEQLTQVLTHICFN